MAITTNTPKRTTIRYSKEFYKKLFTGDTMKRAYMQAVKWYATNVLSKPDLHNVQVEFEKRDNSVPTVAVHLFAVLDEEELRARHCAICKEHYSAFYMNSAAPCNKCEANAYQRRTDDMLHVKLDYYRSLVRKATGEYTTPDAGIESEVDTECE